MKSRHNLPRIWTDYRIKVAALLLTAVFGAIAIVSVTTSSGEDVPEDAAGKAGWAAVTPDLSKAICKSPSDCPPPAPRSRFLRGDNFFELPNFDDSNRSQAEKAALPWRDPFWPAFVRCIQDAGIGVGMGLNPEAATQEDIHHLVEEINRSGPFYFATSRGLEYRGTPASDAFISCETIFYERRPSSYPGN